MEHINEILRLLPGLGITRKDMLGRSNEPMNMAGSESRSWRAMSSRVMRSAVAVSAITGTEGYFSLMHASCV